MNDLNYKSDRFSEVVGRSGGTPIVIAKSKLADPGKGIRMRRRSWLLSIALLFLAPLAVVVLPALGQGAAANPDLKDVLEKGLKARRPEEFAFIAAVLVKVNDGSLSREMVESTFLWARKHSKNEFQYFQSGIRERAKKIGVDL